MPNLPTRVVLFLSSHTPLFLIVAVKYGMSHRYFGLSMLLLSIASVSVLIFYLRTAASLGVDRVAVEKISGKDADAMSYIVTLAFRLSSAPPADRIASATRNLRNVAHIY